MIISTQQQVRRNLENKRSLNHNFPFKIRGTFSVVNNKISARSQNTTVWKLALKGQDHVTVNKPVISIIYIVAHTWPLCSAQILVDGVNPQ